MQVQDNLSSIPVPGNLPSWTFRSQVINSKNGLLATVRGLLLKYARSQILEGLNSGLLKGEIVIRDESVPEEHRFGCPHLDAPKSPVLLKVIRDDFWLRILLSHDIGLSEAYMLGDFEVSSLKSLLELWLCNRQTLSGIGSVISATFASYSALAINAFNRQSSRLVQYNVSKSYDVSNEFFQSFLSKEMMYSCAIWGPEEGGPSGDLKDAPFLGDLENAQNRKISHILKLARIKPGDRLLEIGTGWGAMALVAARQGCIVDTFTLSVEQKALTEQRALQQGLSANISVHLCDYRHLPPSFKGQFDAMAVGIRQWPDYFRMMDWALKEDRAAAVITATSQPEHRYSEYQPNDFARHYHWPDTFLPSPTSLPAELQRAVPRKFVFHRYEDHAIHYCRTLREWDRRLEQNFQGPLIDHLKGRHPELRDDTQMTAFLKKWYYMFVYAEVGYARGYTSLGCWSFMRPEYPSDA